VLLNGNFPASFGSCDFGAFDVLCVRGDTIP